MKKETYPRYLDVEIDGKFKGLYSCDCHAFDSYEDLRKANLQKFTPGQKVLHRCTGKKGIIDKVEGKFVYFNHGSPLWGTAHKEELILI
jgi:hypothetical protein